MEKVAEEVLSYMAANKLAPNKKKTQFIVFTSKRMRPIKVGDCSIQEDSCVTFLGAVIKKKLDWTDHVDQLEKDHCKRNGVIHRLTSYLPQHALLTLVQRVSFPPRSIT
jgi:hypothetical protein